MDQVARTRPDGLDGADQVKEQVAGAADEPTLIAWRVAPTG
ncbi:hypothetical protein [Streptomyces chryseus]|nr:hypothetical protein [Streptomyces chryseus]